MTPSITIPIPDLGAATRWAGVVIPLQGPTELLFFEIRDQGAQSSIRGIKSGQLPRMPKRRGKIPMAHAIETSAISTRPGLSDAADALRREPPFRGKAEIRAQKEVIGAPGLHSQPL